MRNRLMMRRHLLGLFAGLSLSYASLAHANGRFPNAQQLREPQKGFIVVAGSYGLLLSSNAGKDFQFVCESMLFGQPSMGSWIDPLLETLPDGSVLSGSQSGMRFSLDHGCSFQTAFSLPHDTKVVGAGPDPNTPIGSVVDLCPGYSPDAAVVALATARASDGSVVEHRLYQSADGHGAWKPLGNALGTSSLRSVLTLEVAPSKPTRIYVSGSNNGVHTLAVSDDAGATFQTYPIALDDADGVTGAYIAAVSPSNPNRVYVRVSRRSIADDGSDTWDDSLLVSDDGGAHFRDVLRRQAALLGFALSPDGKTVLAGYGDPAIAPLVTSDAALGLYSASSDALTFMHSVPDVSISCLRWGPSGLFACAKERDPLATGASAAGDFHVGLYGGSGAPSGANPFTPLLKLRDVRGPLPWLDGSSSACENEWKNADPSTPTQPSTCASINACGSSTELSPGAIHCGASSGGAATSGGVNGAGQAGTSSGGAGGSAGSAQGGSSGTSNHSAGCSCRMRDARLHTPHDALAAAGALVLAMTRRRRKSSRQP
ncbi:MAG: hypothetical protein QM756_47105 [Polyangiaceae bacterium]